MERPPARKWLSSAEVALLDFLGPRTKRGRKRPDRSESGKDVQAAG
jgi:hypothetical protein